MQKQARTQTDSHDFTEYDTELEGYLTLDDSLYSRPIVFKLLAEESQDSLINPTLLKFLPFTDSVDMAEISYLDMKDFTGTVYKYSEDGTLTAIEAYDQGVLQGVLTDFSDKTETNGRLSYVPKFCPTEPGGDCSSGGGYYVTITTHKYKDWYVSVSGGTYKYAGSDYNGSQSETIYVPGGNITPPPNNQHQHYEAPHGGTPAGSAHPKEVIPTPAFKASKAGCVYEIMTGNKIFAKYLAKFDGDFPVAHLKFDLSYTLPQDVNGWTYPPQNYIIRILINANTLAGRPTLEVARTLMHETIHAEMFRKLISLASNNGSINVSVLNNMLSKGDFPGIYDYYRRYATQWQHQQMAAHYVSVIGQAIKEYDRSQHSDQFYNDLAWGGLMGYKDTNGNIIYFDAWNALSPTDKNRILNTINSFKQSGNKNCP